MSLCRTLPLALFALLLCLSSSWAKELTVVSGSFYPPFFRWNSLNDPKSMEGMLVEFLQTFEDQHPQYEFRHVMLTRRRMDLWMQTGRADIMSLNNPRFVSNPQEYLFTDPLWHVRDLVVTHVDRPVRYEEVDDLFGLRVGVLAGNGYGRLDRYLDSGRIPCERIGSVRQMLRMLRLGRVDALILPRYSVLHRAVEENMSTEIFVFSDTPVLSTGLSLQVQPKHDHFVETMNAFIRQSRKNGLLQQLERAHSNRFD